MKNIIVSGLVFVFLLSCNSELSEKQKEMYVNEGKQISQKVAEKMLMEVGRNMKEGGVLQAAAFCNAHAPEITRQFEKDYNVTIKRTSNKIRNSNNEPNERENIIIQNYLSQNKENYQPIIEKGKDGSVQFYAPILLQDKCTVCHGEIGNTMSVSNDSIIKKLYPTDKATGFKTGDLRGIWSINFSKK